MNKNQSCFITHFHSVCLSAFKHLSHHKESTLIAESLDCVAVSICLLQVGWTCTIDLLLDASFHESRAHCTHTRCRWWHWMFFFFFSQFNCASVDCVWHNLSECCIIVVQWSNHFQCCILVEFAILNDSSWVHDAFTEAAATFWWAIWRTSWWWIRGFAFIDHISWEKCYFAAVWEGFGHFEALRWWRISKNLYMKNYYFSTYCWDNWCSNLHSRQRPTLR